MKPEPALEIPQGVVRFYNFLPAGNPFADEVLGGFSRPQKAIAPRYFLDQQGAELFASLCEQPEYYLLRAEIAILRENMDAILQFAGTGAELIEFRSGIGVQTAVLAEYLRPLVYVPVELDQGILERASRELAELHPWLNLSGMRADVRHPLVLPEFAGLPIRKKIAFMSGSMIGGFAPDEAVAVLRNARRLVGTGGVLLAGVDPGKGRKALESAYNDARGLNARMHLNLLGRINRELNGDFQPGRFSYRADYEAAAGRVVMRLESRYAQFAHVAGRRFDFAPGEIVETGFAHQYSDAEFQSLAHQAGFAPEAVWADTAKQFSIHGMIAA
jgi:dimethylhistidine N-methyltransferase